MLTAKKDIIGYVKPPLLSQSGPPSFFLMAVAIIGSFKNMTCTSFKPLKPISDYTHSKPYQKMVE